MRNKFQAPFFYSSLRLVEYSLFNIKDWRTINFLLRTNLIFSFTKKNKKRLKNIFYKYLKEDGIWREIDKMYLLGLISFKQYDFYESNNFLFFSFLSITLLEIYCLELDFYVSRFLLQYNSLKNLFIIRSLELDCDYSRFIDNYLPLRLDKLLIISKNLRTMYFNNNFYFNILSFRLNCNKLFYFLKRIDYCRYKDQVLMGFTSSFNFLVFCRQRFCSFIRSNLHLDAGSFTISSSNKDSMFFLGFNIIFYFKKIVFGSSNLKFKKSFRFRVNFIKKNFSSICCMAMCFRVSSNFYIINDNKRSLYNI